MLKTDCEMNEFTLTRSKSVIKQNKTTNKSVNETPLR